MVSPGWDFKFPDKNIPTQIIEKCILPHCRESGLPFALMPGARRGVNPPALGLAGDGVFRSDLGAIQNLCAQFPGQQVPRHGARAGSTSMSCA